METTLLLSVMLVFAGQCYASNGAMRKSWDHDHSADDHEDKYNVDLPCDHHMSICSGAMNDSAMWMVSEGNTTFEARWKNTTTNLTCVPKETGFFSNLKKKASDLVDKVKDKVSRGKRAADMIAKGSVAVNAEHIAHNKDNAACCFLLKYAAVQKGACTYNATAVATMQCCRELDTVIKSSSAVRAFSSIATLIVMVAAALLM